MAGEVKVGLMGLGTVGSGVVRLIEENGIDLYNQTGSKISIAKILVQDLEKERSVTVQEGLLTDQAEDILDNKEIDIVVEVMGGIDPARTYIRQALLNGKHVVTANKDVMALHGSELLLIAKEQECDLFYEASVAGGIPILRTLVDGFSSDRIGKIIGIVNGTTNYILTEMTQKGSAFADVLSQAQSLGYAEADPTSDVEGLDAARKMTILGRLGFHMNLSLEDVKVQGISNVTLEDVQFAGQMGYTLKLVGIAQLDGGKVEVSVQPAMLPHHHPLASVDGVYNAVYIYGDAVGETMFYGPGAGDLPTGTAVVSDLVTVVKSMGLGVNGKGTVAPYREKRLKSKREVFSKYFLRLRVKDQAGVLAQLTQLFAETVVSLERVLQLPCSEKGEAEIVLITHTASQHQLDSVKERVEGMEAVIHIQSHYRVEGGTTL